MMEILGWTGAVLVLSAYALVSGKLLPPDSFRYQFLNIAASFLLAIYAFAHDAMASMGVNVVWMLIGVIAVFNILRKSRKLL